MQSVVCNIKYCKNVAEKQCGGEENYQYLYYLFWIKTILILIFCMDDKI